MIERRTLIKGIAAGSLGIVFAPNIVRAQQSASPIKGVYSAPGLSYAGIAQELNISVKSVETQMSHALKFLRTYFRAHGTTITLILLLLQA